jgi:mannosyltransferase
MLAEGGAAPPPPGSLSRAVSTTSRRSVPWILQSPVISDVHPPGWFERLPRWASMGGVLLVLTAISAFVRTRYLSGQLWSEEAAATGIAGHPLGQIFGIVRTAGAAPLYFLLLHLWMSVLGSSEAIIHGLSLLFGLATIPIAMWAGWSLFGRRTGIIAAALFAFSAFLTQYATETQVFELLALLGLLGAAAFLHAFVFGRRRYAILFGLVLVMLLYTSPWAFFFWVGAAVALIPVVRTSSDATAVLRDAGLAFAAALVLFLPWLPTLVFQLGHDTSPWTYFEFTGPTFPASLLGGDRVLATLAVPAAAALLPLLARERRRSAEAVSLWALLAIVVGALLCAGATAIFAESWVTRYFAPLLGAILLLAAFTCARTGVLGLAAVVISIAFVANAASFSAKYKSNLRDVAGELAPLMRPGDTVLVGEPEQAPLAWYYLPSGLHFATLTGPLRDPSTTNWSDAYTRLAGAVPAETENALVTSLSPGRRLLYTRPLTEGAEGWASDWSGLVRRRAAQWSQLLATDPRLRLIAGARAPHYYRGSCCVADSALIYTRVG